MTVAEALSVVAAAYVALTYLGSKLFPRAENVSASDPRFINRHYGSTTDSHAIE